MLAPAARLEPEGIMLEIECVELGCDDFYVEDVVAVEGVVLRRKVSVAGNEEATLGVESRISTAQQNGRTEE